MGYRELHAAAERWIVGQLRAKGHIVHQEKAQNHEVMFDVHDATTDTAYEVLTAKIVRSGHEQDEMILYKLFHYLLLAKEVKFYLVSYGKEELEMFHSMKIEHWHLSSAGWPIEKIGNLRYHRGRTALEAANKIFNSLTLFAPLSEWTKESRRERHPAAAVEKKFAKLTKKLGLPKNFLIGLWRDWRLLWVWRLEYILPMWRRRDQILKKKLGVALMAKIPKRER